MTAVAAPSPSLATHFAALSLGLGLLCGAALALIGGTGLTLWIAGIH